MKRTALTALAVLTLAAAGPASAQTAPAIRAGDPGVAPPALPITLPPIPPVIDRAWPGLVRLEVDATDIERRIFRVRQTIPVEQPGPLVLFFPEWLPGNHGPVGPIAQLAGLAFTAGGQRVEWIRDTLHPYAYHLNVPGGATEITAEFQHLSPTTAAQGRIVMTAEMLNIQWEKMLLYPAGRFSRNITVQPTVTLPDGWRYGVALDPATTQGSRTTFAPIDLEVLVDSPIFAGVHYRQIDLDPGGRSPVRLNLVADSPENLEAGDAQVEILRDLVVQADRLYGARHFDRYDFLVALTDRLGGIGLEHHRSSENSVDPNFFTNFDGLVGDRDLLAHEYNHSWDGKWRRPADQIVPNFNTPLQNSLLWVYEGQTQYYGNVLAARSGLHTRQDSLDSLASVAATFDNRVGREWRAMQDTTNDPIISRRQPKGWLSWQRDEDYYSEGQLIWLDVDTLIRERTNGRRSLDDFARAFYGVQDGDYRATPYTFDDVVRTLNGVMAYDWATFLRDRLDAVGPGARAPLDGLERGGYRLVYRDTPTAWQRRLLTEYGRTDYTYSLGFGLSGSTVQAVRWDGPAFQQGVSVGDEIVAVGDRAYSAGALNAAITAAKGTDQPVRLLVRDGARIRTLTFDYHDGLRYPHLERIEGAPDRLGDIITPRRR